MDTGECRRAGPAGAGAAQSQISAPSGHILPIMRAAKLPKQKQIQGNAFGLHPASRFAQFLLSACFRPWMQSRGHGSKEGFVHEVEELQSGNQPCKCSQRQWGLQEGKGRSFPQMMLRGTKALGERHWLPAVQRCGNTKQLRQMASVKQEASGQGDAV